MRCRECESLVWEYLDDDLPEAQRRLVADHLATCPACTGLYRQMRSFPVPVGQLQAMPPPPDFTARLMQRITPLPTPNELAAQQARTTRTYNGPFGTMIAFAAAAAAILLGLVSTSAMAVFSGRTIVEGQPGSADDPFYHALQVWVVDQVWPLITLPIVATLAVMLAALTLLWVRVVAPRRR
jgi:anti-sigma factor RsiW